MIPYKSLLLTSVPQTPEKRREVLQAVRMLAAQEDAQIRRRRADIAALRRDIEGLRRDCGLLGRTLHQTCREQALSEVSVQLKKYDPDQLRAPTGEPDGGQWTKEDEPSRNTPLTTRITARLTKISRPSKPAGERIPLV
ncbi:MAG: hypothetical protein WBF58_03830 [Xanthobacteraceae bacterium]